ESSPARGAACASRSSEGLAWWGGFRPMLSETLRNVAVPRKRPPAAAAAVGHQVAAGPPIVVRMIDVDVNVNYRRRPPCSPALAAPGDTGGADSRTGSPP